MASWLLSDELMAALQALVAKSKAIDIKGVGDVDIEMRNDPDKLSVVISVKENANASGRRGGGSPAVMVEIVSSPAIGLYVGKIYPGDTITGTDDIAKADLGTLGSTEVLLYNLAEYLNDGSSALDPAADDNVFPAFPSSITSDDGKTVYFTFVRQSEICSSPTGSASILSLNGGY